VIGRLASLIAMTVALFGCGNLDASYGLDRGVASYDALKSATSACEAKGGAIRLRKGYDGQDLSDYDCAVGKAR
jgi:hypothetical protein